MVKEDDMNNSVHHITLDLDKQDSMEYVTVRQGDTAKSLSAMLTESGTPYSIADGAAVVLAARKSDGSYINQTCTVTDNVIEVVLPDSFTQNVGKLLCCFNISHEGKALTSPPFTIYVDAKAAETTS